MADRRRKDVNWLIADDNGQPHSNKCDGVTAAVLMDIRDELKRINAVLHCGNCMAIPFTLDRIARNTAKPRKRRKKKDA